KYTPPDGHITVAVAQEGDEVVLRVSDTGIGIPADMLARIFDLFVQGDQSLAHTSGGLGIGLTLVHRLVKLHHGRVEAHRVGPGRGGQVAGEAARSLTPSRRSTPVASRPTGWGRGAGASSRSRCRSVARRQRRPVPHPRPHAVHRLTYCWSSTTTNRDRRSAPCPSTR